jgi:hypothetical protein
LAGWDSVIPSDEVEQASWIMPRLHGFAVDVGSVVPASFDAYARIFHPAWRNNVEEPTAVRWSEVASANGTVVHPEMQFHAISRTVLHRPSPSMVWDGEPQLGVLPESEGTALSEILARHTATADRCWFCLWEGYGYLGKGSAMSSFVQASPPSEPKPPPVTPEQLRQTFRWPRPHRPSAPRVRLPNRDYLLYRGVVAHSAGWADGPNIWWPDDRAWCVASEIDFPYTYVGGASQLIDEIVACPALEALPARLDHKITADGDGINL